MKKLHGTHSIQPLTITDAVVAEDAQIAESKIALTHTTANLQTDIDNLESTLNAHMEDDADPHGEVLQQTTIRTENITSNVSETDRTITVSNPGGGDLLLDVQGDINCNNLGVSGDTNIDGMTSIGGQTHITGNVLIDGDLTVTGRSTTVTSNTIDYDSLLVTPSTVTNRTGIIVAPDGTGYEEGEGQSQTTTETVTVHDDIVDANDGEFMYPVKELSNGDLLFTLRNRIVKTNSDATEIKATYFVEDEEHEVVHAITVNEDDEVSAIVENYSNYSQNQYSDYRIVTLDSDLEFIRESDTLFENQEAHLSGVGSFEYNNGKYYANYIFTDNSIAIYVYDKTFTTKESNEEYPNNFQHGTGYYDISGLHSTESYWTSLSDLGYFHIFPFTHNGQDYVFVVTQGNMFVLDSNMQLQGYEMWDETDENYDIDNYSDTTMNGIVDPVNKMFYTSMGPMVSGFPITLFLDAQTYVSELADVSENTISTIPVIFDDAYSSMEDLMGEEIEFGWIQGLLSNGTILYYSSDSYNMYWLDPSEFGNITMEDITEQGMELEFSPGLDADFVTHVRRFIVTDEEEAEAAANAPEPEPEEPEEVDPFVMDPNGDPLSSYGLDNFGAVVMNTDADGNFYFVGSAQLADCITKVDAETLKSVSIRIYNAVTDGEYMFGEHGVYGLSISSDKSAAYIACSSMTAETGPTAVYRYDLKTGICDPNIRSDAYLQGGYNNGSVGPYRNIGFNAYTVDYANNRMVLIGGTTDQENDLGGILLLDPEDYSTIKYIKITGAHPYVYSDRWDIHLCVSHDGNYAYVIEFYDENGQYGDPKKIALSKIPLNTQVTSYDPANSPDCIEIALYNTEDIAAYGYPVAIGITPEDRLFVATVNGHVFELDSDTLAIVEETDLLSTAEKEERYGILSMAVNSNTMLVGYENNDSNWNLENYGLRAYDISNGTLLSEATVTESVPYNGPTPAAPILPSEESEEPEEPEEPEYDYFGRDLIRTTTHEVEVVEEVGDTFTGNLLELQKRTNGLNEAAVIVDKHGNLDLLTGDLNIGDTNISDRDSGLVVNNDVVASSITTTDKGFKYEALTDAGASNKVIDVQNSSGVSKFFVDKAGNASANTLQIGSSLPVVWNNTDDSITFSSSVTVADRSINLDDSELVISSDNKTDWRILNRNSTVSFYYGNSSLVPQVEMGDNLFDTSSSNMTKVNNLLVCGDANFRGNVTMASGMLMDGIHLGSHDHSGGDMGVILPQTSVSGLKNFVDNINTTIRNCVDTMTTNNIESGINVAYNSTTEKLNFTVNDFTLTLTGEAEGSATIAHASNTSLAVTVKNSAKLGGLSLPSGTTNTEANKVLRTDSNANTTVKTLSISTPVNAGTASIAKIYASTGSETAVKYYTPANFATQILALGGTVKNSHVHTAVNGLTPLRGSGSFAGTSGKRVNLPASRADTSYTVSITPTANPGGQLGEVWVVKSTAYFTVYNSGTFTGAFDYIVLG